MEQIVSLTEEKKKNPQLNIWYSVKRAAERNQTVIPCVLSP